MQINNPKDYTARPDVILFDLDGTITDMHPVLNWAAPRIYKGFKAAKGALRNLFGIEAAPAPVGENRHRPSWHLPYLRRAVGPGIQQGLIDVLKQADEVQIPTGIVSNGFATGWGWPLIQQYGISKYIDRYVFREQLQRAGGAIKPAPDAILLAMEKWKNDMKPGKIVWFAGDQETDVMAAIAADSKVEYSIVPVAIGRQSAAAKYMRELHAHGEAGHGLIFADYQSFATHLSSLRNPRNGLVSRAPGL